jgi:4-hydroxy-3-methylbut-2-enyl diphosphate reductase
MKVLLANPRGFCAGVDRAVKIVDLALEVFGPPVYVRREIVHNSHVVEALRGKGAVFIEELAAVPPGAVAVLSAHGVAPAVFEEARARSLRLIDATCPLVTKVHLEVHRFVQRGYHILLIGHRGHDEVIGTIGESPANITLVENGSRRGPLRCRRGAWPRPYPVSQPRAAVPHPQPRAAVPHPQPRAAVPHRAAMLR